MKIAIFADIHGKILLPFKLVDLYQKETGEKIDLILQCGDMGAFPNLEKLDKATIKHAKENPEELGFCHDFSKVNPAIKTFLDQLNIPMYCVRGNHEDHDFLDELEQQSGDKSFFPIDVYEKVFLCKTGHGQVFTKSVPEGITETLSFLGVGRIGDRKGRTGKRFIQEYEKTALKKLIKTNRSFDLLITHDKDDQSQRGYGMAEIRNLLDNVLFEFHFYGHTGEPFNQELDYNEITQSVKVKELEFGPSGILPKGCMLILEKDKTDKLSLKVVPQKLTNKLTKYNWKDSLKFKV